MLPMTARANTKQSNAIMAKREDTTPKPKSRRGVRGADPQATIHEPRSRGLNTGTRANCELIDPDKPLTEKQKLFTKFWAEGDSIPGASRRAGYADGAQMAYRMVHMPNVLKLRAEYAAAYAISADMDRKQVMEGLKEAIEMAKLMAEPATMIQGWKVVAQMCGFMAPVETRVKVDVSGNVTMGKLEAMSDAELLALIEQGAPSLPAPAPTVEDVAKIEHLS